MPQRREGAVRVHPLAQVRQDLLSGLGAVQCLQLRPFLGLCVADEREHRLGKDGALLVEAVAANGYVPVLEEMRFDDRFESRFRMTGLAHAYILASRWSSHQTATWQNGASSRSPSARQLRSRWIRSRGTGPPRRLFSDVHHSVIATHTALRLFFRTSR